MPALYGQDKIHVYGHAKDFNGNPIDSVTVRLKQNIDSLALKDKDKVFENSYETLTDRNGYFSLEVDPGTYYCVYAIKEVDYGKTKLEYWAWNVPVYQDLEINPQYDRMEIYGVNGFEPQHGPFNSYMLYFRPMSLTKALALRKMETQPTMQNIAPDSISKEELSVKVNGREAEVVNIDKIKIYTRNGHYMYAYMAQILKPETTGPLHPEEMAEGFDKITIVLHSAETNEYGKGEYFLKKIGN